MAAGHANSEGGGTNSGDVPRGGDGLWPAQPAPFLVFSLLSCDCHMVPTLSLNNLSHGTQFLLNKIVTWYPLFHLIRLSHCTHSFAVLNILNDKKNVFHCDWRTFLLSECRFLGPLTNLKDKIMKCSRFSIIERNKQKNRSGETTNFKPENRMISESP